MALPKALRTASQPGLRNGRRVPPRRRDRVGVSIPQPSIWVLRRRGASIGNRGVFRRTRKYAYQPL